jgi:hypothetical protein
MTGAMKGGTSVLREVRSGSDLGLQQELHLVSTRKAPWIDSVSGSTVIVDGTGCEHPTKRTKQAVEVMAGVALAADGTPQLPICGRVA